MPLPILPPCPSILFRPLTLAHGLAFTELYSTDGAARLDGLFVAHLEEADAPLAARLDAARASPADLTRKDESELLIALGPHLEDFLGALFGIEADVRTLEARHHELAPLYAVKRQFVQRKAMNTHRADAAAAFDGPALQAGAGSCDGHLLHRTRVRRGGDAMAAGRDRERRRARRGAALCGVGVAHAGRPRGAQGRRPVPRAAQARLHEPRSGRAHARERRRRLETCETVTCGDAKDSR